jgi:hypothetical protein
MVSQTNEQALENCIERALVEGSRYEKSNLAECDRFLCHTKNIDSPLHLCVLRLDCHDCHHLQMDN